VGVRPAHGDLLAELFAKYGNDLHVDYRYLCERCRLSDRRDWVPSSIGYNKPGPRPVSDRTKRLHRRQLVERMRAMAVQYSTTPEHVLQSLLMAPGAREDFPQLFKQTRLNESKEKVVENVQKLLKDVLPKHSVMRQDIISVLAEGLTAQVAAAVMDCSEGTVKAARRSEKQERLEEKKTPLQQPYPTNRKSARRIPVSELEELLEFIKRLCPVSSGAKRPHHRQFDADKDLYQLYVQSLEIIVRAVADALGGDVGAIKDKSLRDNIERLRANDRVPGRRMELLATLISMTQLPTDTLEERVAILKSIISFDATKGPLTPRAHATLMQLRNTLKIRRVRGAWEKFGCCVRRHMRCLALSHGRLVLCR
jgi:hypothetical protein